MDSVILFADQAKMLMFNERFIIMPCFLLVAVFIFIAGIGRIRNKRFGLKPHHQWMYGKSEMTGPVAVISGYVFCALGVFMFLYLCVRIIDGRQ